MVTAAPVKQQFDLVSGQLHDDLLEHGAHDAFPRLRCRAGMRPGRLEIRAERQQAVVLRGRQSFRVGSRQVGDPFFLPLHVDEAIVPSAFELGGDQAVRRVDRVELAAGQVRLVPRLGQRQLRLMVHVGVRLFAYHHRLESSLDAERAQEPQHFGRHRRVDAHAAERDAPTRPMVETRTATAVANALALGPAVGNVDPSSAMPAAQQTREQPLSAANRATRQQTIPSSVVRDHTLVPLVLCPRNIALVVIHDQHIPLLAFPGEPPTDALASVLDRDTASRSTERVGATVDRVGQQSVNRAVDRKSPYDPSAVAVDLDRRQAHVLLPEPEMHLSDALELGELPEYEAERFLHASIRILGDPVVPDLHVADRDAQEQFTATRLLPERFERALAQQ